ncbi:hypothetical protein A6302_01896 [Methylobrevis pamukkalensis]|uniref:Peptidase M48 domain-containing protein n=1 Tax=Methylobrevis pamukkalensis TaxID=1439726 RepID=A0A1E3H395_9HYPH|nr:hypothetical protein A6302_01896 [Methylobrevis pamukkalensis]
MCRRDNRRAPRAVLGPIALALLALAASPGPAAAETCRAFFMAEYCFPVRSVMDLMPVDDLERRFAEETARLVERLDVREVALPPEADLALQERWLVAVGDAVDYAWKHTLRLTPQRIARERSALPSEGQGFMNMLARMVSAGALLRLEFDAAREGRYTLRRVRVHRGRLVAGIQAMSAGLPAEFAQAGQAAAMMLAMLPDDGGYIDAADLALHPMLAPLMPPGSGKAEEIGRILLGTLGIEATAVFFTAFDQRLLERNDRMSHRVVVYDPEGPDLPSPQVTFDGRLLLPRPYLDLFSDDELGLLLRHEAMHLAKPNVLLTLQIAYEMVRFRFPDLNPDMAATFASNLFGYDNAYHPRGSCPIKVPPDDEMLIDYAVLQQMKSDPAAMDRYQALLERLHREFNPGTNSEMDFRVRYARIIRDEIDAGDSRRFSLEQENADQSAAIQTYMMKAIQNYAANGTMPTMDALLDEVELYPSLRFDAMRMRLIIGYYRIYGGAKKAVRNVPGASRPAGTDDCEALGRMLRMEEP